MDAAAILSLLACLGLFACASAKSQEDILAGVQHAHDPDGIRVHLVQHPVSTDENLADPRIVEVRDNSPPPAVV